MICPLSDFQQLAGLLVSRRPMPVPVLSVVAVHAGRDASQGDQMPPSESGASRRELFGHGAIVFLAVEPAVFADRKAEHQVEHRPRRMVQFAVTQNRG